MTYYLLELLKLFSRIELKDVFDVAIVAILIYAVILFIRQTKTYFIVYAAVTLFLLNYFANLLNLSLVRIIFQPLLTFIIVIFAVVFQREIRRFFVWFSIVGRRSFVERKIAISSGVTNNIVDAVVTLAERKVGALIVFAGDYPLETLVEGGYALDGRVSVPLLLSIFDPSTPGHDGAVVIDNNKVKRFGTHLPLAENIGRVNSFGTRHRAALGLSERTDAMILVVSEERGTISIAEGGEIEVVSNPREVENRIIGFMKENIVDDSQGGVWPYMVERHLWSKILAIGLAILAWFFFVY